MTIRFARSTDQDMPRHAKTRLLGPIIWFYHTQKHVDIYIYIYVLCVFLNTLYIYHITSYDIIWYHMISCKTNEPVNVQLYQNLQPNNWGVPKKGKPSNTMVVSIALFGEELEMCHRLFRDIQAILPLVQVEIFLRGFCPCVLKCPTSVGMYSKSPWVWRCFAKCVVKNTFWC